MPKPIVRRAMKPAHEYDNEIVQIDVENPAKDRVTEDGKRRLMLNEREKQIINEQKLMEQALILMVEKGLTVPELSKELNTPQAVFVTAITHQTHPEFRKQVIYKAIDMLLDLSDGHTRTEIQNALGLSRDQFRILTTSEEFVNMYNDMFLEMRSHPGIQAVQNALLDELLPKSFKVISELMTDTKVSASVRLKAALAIWDKAGIRGVDSRENDRSEIAEFLRQQGISVQNNVQNVNVNVPLEFQSAMKEANETIEGEFQEVAEA